MFEISRFDCLSVQRLSLGPDNEQQSSMMAVADHGLMFENQQESGAGQGINEVSPQSYRYNAHTFLSFSIIPCIALSAPRLTCLTLPRIQSEKNRTMLVAEQQKRQEMEIELGAQRQVNEDIMMQLEDQISLNHHLRRQVLRSASDAAVALLCNAELVLIIRT